MTTKNSNRPIISAAVTVYDVDGFPLARVTPGYLEKALDNGEVARDETGNYRLRKTGGYRTLAQIDADRRRESWERTYGPKPEQTPAEAELAARRSAAAHKAIATRRARKAGQLVTA